MAIWSLRLVIAAAAAFGIGAAAADEAPRLFLAPGGLEVAPVSGAPVLAGFGDTEMFDARKTAIKAWGKPAEEGRMEECGAGPLDFARFGNDVTLHFQDGTFVGWSAGSDSTATLPQGAGVGSSLTEIEAAAGTLETFESSLGREFAAGEVFGIASGPGTDARVELFWSGVSCIFR